MQCEFPQLNAVFQAQESSRVRDALKRFLAHRPTGIALVGSLAMACQIRANGGIFPDRPFGDIDLAVRSIDSLPSALAEEFICAHVHAGVGPGRILLQLVHPVDAVRIDVFSTSEGILSRSGMFQFDDLMIPVVSLADQAARAAFLCMKMVRGGTVAAKHVRDLELMLPLISASQIETAWSEHRHASDPSSFKEASKVIRDQARGHPERLVIPEFATDLEAACPRCAEAGVFRPAAAAQVFSILGYV